jgi:hypothetical protein
VQEIQEGVEWMERFSHYDMTLSGNENKEKLISYTHILSSQVQLYFSFTPQEPMGARGSVVG